MLNWIIRRIRINTVSTTLTFEYGPVSNSSWGSLSSPGADSYTNVVCGPGVQLVQYVGNTSRVLYWYNPVLCTWTLRCIAHLFMVGGRMGGRNGGKRSRRDRGARKGVEGREMKKRKEMNK